MALKCTIVQRFRGPPLAFSSPGKQQEIEAVRDRADYRFSLFFYSLYVVCFSFFFFRKFFHFYECSLFHSLWLYFLLSHHSSVYLFTLFFISSLLSFKLINSSILLYLVICSPILFFFSLILSFFFNHVLFLFRLLFLLFIFLFIAIIRYEPYTQFQTTNSFS